MDFKYKEGFFENLTNNLNYKDLKSIAFDEATKELSERRNKARDLQLKRRAEISIRVPEAELVQKKILSTSNEIVKAIADHSENIDDVIIKIKNDNLLNQERLGKLLAEYGYQPDYLKTKYSCQKCKDTGFVEGKMCDCLSTLVNEKYKKLAIEKVNKNCRIKLHDFSEFDLKYYSKLEDDNGVIPYKRMESLELFCEGYCDKFSINSQSLFFLGKTGIGKTFISSMIAKSLIEKGFYVAFDSVGNFLTEIENEHFGRTSGDTKTILLNADLLILDDLGSEFSSSFNDSTLYSIIDSRINSDMPTIISTNLSLSELEAKYDQRIISRLTGLFTPIRFFGTDIRQIKRKMFEN